MILLSVLDEKIPVLYLGSKIFHPLIQTITQLLAKLKGLLQSFFYHLQSLSHVSFITIGKKAGFLRRG